MMETLKIENDSPSNFRKKLIEIKGGENKENQKSYLVEKLQDGTTLEIRKPGFKGIHDIQVWANNDSKTWMPTFVEMLRDFSLKIEEDKEKFTGFYYTSISEVFSGKDPEDLPYDGSMSGFSFEYILKVLKWWFGEEDCNYPMPKYQGRKMIMYRIRELLDGIELDQVIYRAKVKGRPPPPDLKNVDYKQVDDLVK
jgi:hypothetical protein